MRGFFNAKFLVKEVKKCFSKPTEKSEKNRGISLNKQWICAYKSHLLGTAPKTRKTGGEKNEADKNNIFVS